MASGTNISTAIATKFYANLVITKAMVAQQELAVFGSYCKRMNSKYQLAKNPLPKLTHNDKKTLRFLCIHGGLSSGSTLTHSGGYINYSNSRLP